jgi:hypothetical protein
MDFANLGKDKPNDNRRRAGRVVLQSIGCSLGTVLDLSSSGLRVETSGKPVVAMGQTFGMVLQSLAGPVNIVATVAWVRKSGWRAHQVGLMIVDPSPELRRAINELARGVTTNESIRPDHERLRDAG